MYILVETSDIRSIAKNIKTHNVDKIRFECVLQTTDSKNRNRRIYPKTVLEESLSEVTDRIKAGSLLGELDHPIDSNPVRQCTVWYKEASHRILDTGWDGNKLIGIMESLRTPNGYILRNLAQDGVPIGFSYRGMGDLEQINESYGNSYFKVKSPLKTITWDSVTHPSHEGAQLYKINESVSYEIREQFLSTVSEYEEDSVCEKNGLICTSEGVCYLPNDFDKLVETKKVSLINKYKI